MKKLHQVGTGGLAGRKTVLVSFWKKEQVETRDAAQELELLTSTLGLKLVQTFIVRVHQINPATYLGQGKLQELKNLRDKEDIFLFVFGEELSPVQQRNLENSLQARVLDRTGLILEIFAEHARSREGKIQVELARLTYLLPRLTGHGIWLSRIAGGGGLAARGPGEMKLEVYRRRIREQIHWLNLKIGEIEKHRALLRNGRRKKNLLTAALLGYTNVGKSTLLNSLSCRKELLVADQLFSTLDPATRAVYLGDNRYCLVTDTVGLIHDLPHHLIAAFKATLEEVVFSDLILCLYDGSSPALDRHRATTFEVMKLLDVADKPYLEVFNKTDLVTEEESNILKASFPDGIFVSSIQGQGLDVLKARMREVLYAQHTAGA